MSRHWSAVRTWTGSLLPNQRMFCHRRAWTVGVSACRQAAWFVCIWISLVYLTGGDVFAQTPTNEPSPTFTRPSLGNSTPSPGDPVKLPAWAKPSVRSTAPGVESLPGSPDPVPKDGPGLPEPPTAVPVPGAGLALLAAAGAALAYRRLRDEEADPRSSRC